MKEPKFAVYKFINLKIIIMKKTNFHKLIGTAIACIAMSMTTVSAQETEVKESAVTSDVGMDVYSSYVWRGAKFGTGAAFQPWMELSAGGLTFGSWGSVNSGGTEALEMDLYLGYSFDFGLSLTVTDYYFGGNWMDFETMHFIEPSLSYEAGAFSFTGAYMLGDDTEDVYVELAYSLDVFDLAIGAGNGAYTTSGDFGICNITLSKSKELKISDSFSLPIVGAMTLNPYNEAFYVYAGISF